jgi:GGDEF domain-containing protein
VLSRGIQGKGRAYRYGGEEVALILPNHSTEEALALAERLRRQIEGVLAAGVRRPAPERGRSGQERRSKPRGRSTRRAAGATQAGEGVWAARLSSACW